MASTTAHKVRKPARASRPTKTQRQRAAALVDDADQILSEAVTPGRWPQEKTVSRFLASGHLERVLSLYSQAMTLDAKEPAYPWNLASALRRLGQHELASAFLVRAIQVGEAADDGEYSGPDAYLALAELALDSDNHDAALVALARAHERSANDSDIADEWQRLFTELFRRGSNEDRASLLHTLDRITS